MGKAAENEKKKLRASGSNSLAVALLFGGFYLPIFSIWISEKLPAFSVFAVCAIAVLLAYVFHRTAISIAGTIED